MSKSDPDLWTLWDFDQTFRKYHHQGEQRVRDKPRISREGDTHSETEKARERNIQKKIAMRIAGATGQISQCILFVLLHHTFPSMSNLCKLYLLNSPLLRLCL